MQKEMNFYCNKKYSSPMKKISLILIFIMLLGILSCGGTDDDDKYEDSDDKYEDSNVDSKAEDTKSFTVDFVWSNENSYIRIQGTVKNNTDETYNYRAIHIIAKDANDNLLGVDTAYLEPSTLLPGKEAMFTAYIWDTNCPTSVMKLSCSLSKD